MGAMPLARSWIFAAGCAIAIAKEETETVMTLAGEAVTMNRSIEDSNINRKSVPRKF
jgi:hypothetical protein